MRKKADNEIDVPGDRRGRQGERASGRAIDARSPRYTNLLKDIETAAAKSFSARIAGA